MLKDVLAEGRKHEQYRELKMHPVKVGYIVDEGAQPYLVWDLIEKSKLSEEYSIDLMIVQKSPGSSNQGLRWKVIDYYKRKGVRRLAERILIDLIIKFEKKLFAHHPEYNETFIKKSLDEIDVQKIYLTSTISGNGLVYRYVESDIEAIKGARLDVLLRGGSGILRGKILDTCEFGVLSFHHANNDINRGGPPAFWEVLSRQPSTGFIIQRLTEELDGGDVVFKGEIATSPFYVLNLCKLHRKSNFFMDHVLKNLARRGKLPDIFEKTPYAYPLFKTPSISVQLQYLYKTIIHILKVVYGKFAKTSWRWGVAYQYVDSWKSAVLWKSRIIKNPANRFLADPFVFRKDGLDVIFVEDYDYITDKGDISAYKVDRDQYEALGKVLIEPFHLSYPFLFEADSRLFMCPETHEAGDIRIYECVDFPLKWTLHKILVKNIVASDTNILFYNGMWWMLTNIDTSDLGDRSSELHLFYSDRYDSEQWNPHPLNPIILDSKCARNGGLLFDEEGLIYRVYQRQGFDMYGEAMGVARIDVISTVDYKETVLFDIEPRFFNGIAGTHTYSFHDRLMALDFVKREGYRH